VTIISLQAKQDHLEKVARTADAVRGLAEFVWNSVDADAQHVEILFVRNVLGGVEEIHIRDDGGGINLERAQSEFGQLGQSWKKLSARTPLNRAVHGKEGRGRLRFFSLANRCCWRTTYRDTNGQYRKLRLEIEAGRLEVCDLIGPEETTETSTGTTVELISLKGGHDWLASSEARSELTAIFATYLKSYPNVTIKFDGEAIDPDKTISRMHGFEAGPVICPNRTVRDLNVRIIEWSVPIPSRKMHFCDENGIVLGSQAAHVVAPGFAFSAYASSALFSELADANLLEMEELNDADFIVVRDFVREHVQDYFRGRATEQASGLIDELRQAGVYPYEGEPSTEVERRERQVFDIATHAVQSYHKGFRKSDNSVKQFTLALLREAIRHNPDSLTHILSNVVKLPKSKQNEFSGLLKRTELSNIIAASGLIAERVAILTTLNEIVFGESRKLVKERGELDVLVRDHTWLFGERFHMSLSEVGLTKVINRVLEDIGEKKRKGSVRRADGRTGRVDQLLGRRIPHSAKEAREYVIVELKKPDLVLTRSELDQIEDYALTLTTQLDYAHTQTEWTFFLVGGSYDETVRSRIHQRGRERGLYKVGDNYEVWVKTWAELLRDASGRLEFIQAELNIQVSEEDIADRIAGLRASLIGATSDAVEQGAETHEGATPNTDRR